MNTTSTKALPVPVLHEEPINTKEIEVDIIENYRGGYSFRFYTALNTPIDFGNYPTWADANLVASMNFWTVSNHPHEEITSTEGGDGTE